MGFKHLVHTSNPLGIPLILALKFTLEKYIVLFVSLYSLPMSITNHLLWAESLFHVSISQYASTQKCWACESERL